MHARDKRNYNCYFVDSSVNKLFFCSMCSCTTSFSWRERIGEEGPQILKFCSQQFKLCSACCAVYLKSREFSINFRWMQMVQLFALKLALNAFIFVPFGLHLLSISWRSALHYLSMFLLAEKSVDCFDTRSPVMKIGEVRKASGKEGRLYSHLLRKTVSNDCLNFLRLLQDASSNPIT